MEFAHALNENYDCCYPSCALRRAQKIERGAAPKPKLVMMRPEVTQHLRADIPFQSEEQFTYPNWVVTRQACPAQPKPSRSTEAAAHLHREWSGEICDPEVLPPRPTCWSNGSVMTSAIPVVRE